MVVHIRQCVAIAAMYVWGTCWNVDLSIQDRMHRVKVYWQNNDGCIDTTSQGFPSVMCFDHTEVHQVCLVLEAACV